MCERENNRPLKTRTQTLINAKHSLLIPPLRSVFVSMLRGYYAPLTQHNWPHHAHTKSANSCISHTHKLPVSLSSTISHTHLLVPFPLHCCRSSGHTQHQPNSHKHSVSSTTGTFMSHGGFLITLTDWRFFTCFSIRFYYFTLVDFQS